jgi:hypothetical protein
MIKMGRIITDWADISEIPSEAISLMKDAPRNIWFLITKTLAGNRVTISVWRVPPENAEVKEGSLMFAQAGAQHLGSVDAVLKFKPRPKVKEKLEKIIRSVCLEGG